MLQVRKMTIIRIGVVTERAAGGAVCHWSTSEIVARANASATITRVVQLHSTTGGEFCKFPMRIIVNFLTSSIQDFMQFLH